MFHDYLSRFEARDLRRALIDLFRVLDTKIENGTNKISATSFVISILLKKFNRIKINATA